MRDNYDFCNSIKNPYLKQSKTDWEILESMKDEDIDFSDCPEITTEMAKNATIRSGFKDSSGKKLLTLIFR